MPSGPLGLSHLTPRTRTVQAQGLLLSSYGASVSSLAPLSPVMGASVRQTSIFPWRPAPHETQQCCSDSLEGVRAPVGLLDCPSSITANQGSAPHHHP